MFLGKGGSKEKICSIERLDLRTMEAIERGWSLIELSGIFPRSMLGVAVLNSFEIVILGGYAAPKTLADVYIFGRKTVDRISSNNMVKIASGPYPVAKVCQNLVITADFNTKRFI